MLLPGLTVTRMADWTDGLDRLSLPLLKLNMLSHATSAAQDTRTLLVSCSLGSRNTP